MNLLFFTRSRKNIFKCCKYFFNWKKSYSNWNRFFRDVDGSSYRGSSESDKSLISNMTLVSFANKEQVEEDSSPVDSGSKISK